MLCYAKVLSREIPKLLAQFPSEGTDQHAPTQAMSQALAATSHNVPAIQGGDPQMQLTYQPEPAAPPPQQQFPPPQQQQQQQYQQPYPPQPAAPPAGGMPWAVSPADKARYDEVFASVGPQNGARRHSRPRTLAASPHPLLCLASPLCSAARPSGQASSRARRRGR
jgi:hypothetical protein